MSSIFKGAPLHDEEATKPNKPNYNMSAELYAELEDSKSVIDAELENSKSVINVELIQQGKDGASIEFQWKGTELGIRVEGEEEYTYMDLTSEMTVDRDMLIGALGFEPAQADLLQKHLDDLFVHITPEEREKWNREVDLSDVYDRIQYLSDNTVGINKYNEHVENSFSAMVDIRRDLDASTQQLGSSIEELRKTKADRRQVLQLLDGKSNTGHNHDELYASKQYLEEKILELSLSIRTQISDLEDDIKIATQEYIQSLGLEGAHEDIEALKRNKADLEYVQSELDKVNKQIEDTIADIEIFGLDAAKADIEMLKDTKVDKELGKVLSSNDFTDLLHAKLTNIEHDANKYIHPEKHPASIIDESENKRFVSDFEKDYWSNKADKTDVPTKTSQLVNDESFLTSSSETISNIKNSVTSLDSSKADQASLDTHTNNNSNPHNVTKAQLNLGNVDNTSDLDKPISTATQSALEKKANQDEIPTKITDLTDNIGINKITDTATNTQYKIIMENGIPYFEEI